jgi:hypothetical protein
MLSDAHKQAALAHLNEIAPDTFDEGEFGPWTFTGLRREDDTWVLEFDNAEGADGVRFKYAGDCVDEAGSVADDWFEQINQAILEWESEVSGHGDY